MPKDENAYYVPRPEKCPHCKLAVETANAFCERCGWDLVSGLTKRAQRGSRVKCIYCEERRPRTVEDIFPKWLSRQFPNCPSRAPNRVRRATELKAFSRPVLYADPAKKPARKAYHLTTKEVCGPCNNGWMSNLQDQMKPILLKMIGSNSSGVSLNEDEKIIATRWCCMTFINLFYSENANSTLQHQRTAIMNGQVPRGWSVGAGILNDRSMAGRYERYSAGMLIESFDRPFTRSLAAI